eukprot:scaffold8394_cov143-Skeletonema_marinoi.AAC.4
MADERSTTAPRRRKRRWDSSANPQEEGKGPPATAKNDVAPSTTAAPPTTASAAADPRARAAALQASIQARLAALKARTPGASTALPPAALAALFPSSSSVAQSQTKKRSLESENDNKSSSTTTKKARVYELDMSITAPTRILEKAASAVPTNRPKINPYLAHTVNDDGSNQKQSAVKSNSATTTDTNATDIQKQSTSNTTSTDIFDPRIANGQISKQRQRHRPINFITPGTYIAIGEKKREMAARAEESGYISGRKVGNVLKSVGMASVAVDGGDGGGGSYYGSGEAGKLLEERLPSRVDAPELDIEEYTKKSLLSKKDVEIASDKDLPVMDALKAAESTMPYAMEWWDAELLPSKLRKELAAEEGKVIASRARRQGGVKKAAAAAATTNDSENIMTPMQQFQNQQGQHNQLLQKCYNTASLTHSKSHALVQHPIPIITPAQKAAQEALKNKPPTLHLTKAEQKRHRKLRRAERQREQQDLQAAGLIEPPEPRLTLSNYMKVLGDQAVLDPSKMEARVMEQIQGRKLKHEQMNADRKLTKEEKAAKHARKLHEDTTQSVCVALYWVRDMGHPYHRAKVDLNAQQNHITGGVLECETGEVLVVAEGGEKAIKRYTRLMTVRMKWKGEDFYEEEEEEEEEDEMMEEDNVNDGEEGTTTKVPRKKFNPNNECELIWTGMAVKRAFHSFMFQTAANSTTARKILEAKGVAHYWDLAAGHYERKVGYGANGDEGALRFRLGN